MFKIYIHCHFFKRGLSCDAVKRYKIPVPSKKINFHRMHYERCESNKTPSSCMFHLPSSFLLQSVFVIIHVHLELLGPMKVS